MRFAPQSHPTAGEAPEQRRWHFDARLGGAIRLDVSVGSIATEPGLSGDVRFTPGSDRTADVPDRQLCATRADSSAAMKWTQVASIIVPPLQCAVVESVLFIQPLRPNFRRRPHGFIG
jgi:hypothetical protein